MRFPYVIDNETHGLADVLNELLASNARRSLDVATAHFTVGGYSRRCPPDKQEKATQTVLEQAEVLSAEWAVA